MLPVSISVSADVVAWYAALLSTVAVTVQVLKYWQGRVRMALKIKANYRVLGGGDRYPKDKDYIVVSVMNKGVRPITIKQVGFTEKDKEGFNVSSEFGPRKLTDGESTDYLFEQDLVDLEQVEYFYALDSLDREVKRKFKKNI